MRSRLHSPFWRRALRALGGRLFRLAENNDNPYFATNGEKWLLRQVLQAHAAAKRGRPCMVFDAGANIGGYTRLALEEARRTGVELEVHAFEPSPSAGAALRRAFAAEPRVHIVEAALSNQAGEGALFGGRAGNSQASLVPRAAVSAEADMVRVSLLRLEDYIAQQAIAYIDFLKLDVEGAEFSALQGLGACLRPDFVSTIQFEYGGTALDAGTTLREIYHLLTVRGFIVGKLFPRAMEVRPYRAWMENYAYANYVALDPRWLPANKAGALV